MTTAHERHEAQVKTGTWMPYNDLHVDNLQRQREALIAERDALRLQVAALAEERDALKEDVKNMQVENTALLAWFVAPNEKLRESLESCYTWRGGSHE